MTRQDRLDAEEPQERQGVLDGMLLVVLRQRLVAQNPVEPFALVVIVADPHPRADESRHEAILNLPLRMGVDGNVVATPAQTPQESERRQLVAVDQVLLKDGINVRIPPQYVA